MMLVLHKISRLVGHCSRFMGWMGGLGITILMLIVVADVGLRAIRGKGLIGSVEYSEVLLSVCVFLGIAAAERSGAHVRTAALTALMPWRWGRWVFLIGAGAALVTLIVTTIASLSRALAAFSNNEIRSAIIDVHMWPIRTVIVIGLAFVTLEFIRTTWKTFTGQPPKETPSGSDAPAVPVV